MANPAPDELDKLDKIIVKIHSKGRLGEEERNLLSQVFSNRFERAIRIVDEKRVTKYNFEPSGREVWTVRGQSGIYQIMPTTLYCSCDDFYFRVLGGKRGVCYHIIAQILASTLSKFVEKELPDKLYREVLAKTET